MIIKQRVLFLEKPNVEQLADFESKFECVYYDVTTLEQTIIDLQTKLSDIVAIYCGWAGFGPIGGLKGKLLSYLPESLRIVTTCSIGYDIYDVDGLSDKGIILTNVPSTIAFDAVADLVLYNTINSFRNFKFYETALRDHNLAHTGVLRTSLLNADFDAKSGTPVIKPMRGNTYGYACCQRENLSPKGHNAVIVGFGNIGMLIGDRLACIGMNVHYVKRNRLSEEQEQALGYDVTYHASLDTVKDIADLVILCCPGTPSTRHMINRDFINGMQKPFRVINVGRGFIIDEDALVEGLQSKKVIHASLDVFEQEPLIRSDLVNRQDVTLTPHIGSGVAENYKHSAVTSLNNIETVLFGYNKQISRVN